MKIFSSTNRDTEGVTVRSTRCTHGEFSHKGSGNCEWILRTISSGTQPILRGVMSSDENGDDDGSSSSNSSTVELVAEGKKGETRSSARPIYLKLLYSNKGHIPSGIKVDSLKIVSAKGLGDTVKPYKGVKYITKAGEYVVRA